MSITAILAMDSYNRGYSPGLVLSGSAIETATINSRKFRRTGRPDAVAAAEVAAAAVAAAAGIAAAAADAAPPASAAADVFARLAREAALADRAAR